MADEQQPNAVDLHKIVLTRSDLLELEKKCTFDELFDICNSCLARVQLHNTNMVWIRKLLEWSLNRLLPFLFIFIFCRFQLLMI
jgi:hypothetical protein